MTWEQLCETCSGKKVATVHAEGRFLPVKYYENYVHKLPLLQPSYICLSISKSSRRIFENLDQACKMVNLQSVGKDVQAPLALLSRRLISFIKTAFWRSMSCLLRAAAASHTMGLTRSMAWRVAWAFHHRKELCHCCQEITLPSPSPTPAEI